MDLTGPTPLTKTVFLFWGLVSINMKLTSGQKRYREFCSSGTMLRFYEWLGIQPPRIEFLNGPFFGMPCRYVSGKYKKVKGGWCNTYSAAKASYKEELNKHLREIREKR